LNDSISSDVASVMSALDIAHTVIECEPEFADTQRFCDHYGYSVDESANVLLITSKRGERKFAACVVLATCRLDGNKTARKKLGASRISFASPKETREITGMELGGVTPFGMPENVPVWIDSRVMECKRVILGGGNRSSKIVLTPAMLLKIPNAEVVENLAYQALTE
jgi:prolyl-tRNA editing enzyme YbaK/EbsC (Cys-tRNA(Pro) deacylase)